MTVTDIQLYNILKIKLGEKEAQSLVDFVHHEVESEVNAKKDIFLTKDDKIDIMRSIYLVGLIQFLAIVASISGIINYMLHK